MGSFVARQLINASLTSLKTAITATTKRETSKLRVSKKQASKIKAPYSA